ncbi:MAG: transglycosylase domain-containing protein [Desulfitobacteriaceae bacterium]
MSPRTKTQGTKGKRRLSKWRLFLLTAVGIFGIGMLGALIFVGVSVAKTPKWDPGAITDLKQSSILYDKDGQQIATLHADENRLVAESKDIPKLVKDTFVAVEDRRFYQHFGVDPIRIVGAAFNDIVSRSRKEGASTITIQLARNAFIENPTAKTFTRKIQEAALALQLEHEYTKDQILTFYLNKIFFGESSFGIRTAAKTYFGKDDLNQLTPPEVALLAGLPQAPSGYDPYINPDNAKYRRNIVLGLMKDSKIISEEEYAKYKEEPFTYVKQMKNADRSSNQETSVASTSYKFPYFVDYVIQELGSTYNLSEDQIFNGGLHIYTTVNPKIQSEAEAQFAKQGNFPQSLDAKIPIEGAMTVIEQGDGAIRAMVGGRNYTPRGLNRAWQANRQPGSTIKPLVVYGPALEKGGYFPGTVLDDMPVKYSAGNGKVWAPVDFDTETSGWKGLITMREALRNSVNVYAVKLMNQIGVEYGWKFGKEKLGLPLKDSERYNLSLALGTTEVSTLDMTAAYGVYANNGVSTTTHAVEKILDSQGNQVAVAKITKQKVMKETTAYLINDMLNTVVKEGTGRSAQISGWAVAGKTGTTSLPEDFGNRSGNPDAWFAGYTPKYTAVVWMGYDKTDKEHYLRKVYGGSYPAKIWKAVMTAALAGEQPQASFSKPSGIVSGSIDTKSGLLPSSLTPSQFITTEIAVQGNFPATVSGIWVEKEVDEDNPTYLASDTTKHKLSKVFLNITDRDPSWPWPSDEAPYRMPTEYAPSAPAASTEPSISPPKGDDKLPTPDLGRLTYKQSTGTANIDISFPPGSNKYSVVIYLHRPGATGLETYIPDGVSGKSFQVSVPIGGDGNEIAPGEEYTFWAAAIDPKTQAVGPPSNSVKYKPTD